VVKEGREGRGVWDLNRVNRVGLLENVKRNGGEGGW